MQALLETGAGLERRFTLKVPLDPIEREFAARIRSLDSRSAECAQEDDYKNLRTRIIQGVEHASYLEAVSQHKLSAIGTPDFGSAVEENGWLVFSVDFAVRPEIDTSSYGDIGITRPTAEVGDHDVDAAIRAQYGSVPDGDTRLRADIREKLEYQLEDVIRQAIKPQLMEALLARHSFTPPAVMVAREFENRMAGWRQRQAGNPALQIPAEAQVRFNSGRAVSLGIIFTEIIRSANIVPGEARIRRAIDQIANTQKEPEEVINRYYRDEAMLARVEEAVKIDMAIDWVASQASVVDVPSSFAQLVGGIG